MPRPFLLLGLLLFLLHLATASSILTVHTHYPLSSLGKAHTLAMRGSGLGLSWSKGVPMSHEQEDLWRLDIPIDRFGGASVEMKVLIDDDVWMVGANIQILLRPGIVDVYPWFGTQGGSIEFMENVFSPQLNNSRTVSIYLPPSYAENTLKPIQSLLIAHDGNNMFESTPCPGVQPCCPFGCWHAETVIDQLITEAKMHEIAVVAPYNNADRNDELTYSYDPTQKEGGKGDLYLDWIEQTLLPAARDKYPRFAASGKVGILGSSLGGLISCYAGWTRSSVYSVAGCMSSSFWWNAQDFNNTVMEKGVPEILTVYVDSGEDGKNETIVVRDHMVSLGFGHVGSHQLKYYYDAGAQHSEAFWHKRFHVPMEYMYAPTPQ